MTAELQLRAPSNAAAVVATIQRQLNGINANVNLTVTRQSINQINQVNKSLKQVKTNAVDAANGFEAFGKQAALAVRRFGAFVTATFAFRQLVTSITAGVGEAIDFERQVVKIAQVTNSAVRDMKDLSGEVTRLATTLGVSSTKLIQAAQVLAQAGLSAKDTKTALDALAKSELSPTFEDISETTEGAIAIFQQFGKEAKDLEGILGSLNAVSGKFAVESSDLISAVRRTGGAFKAAGGNLDELSALFTSVRATTRESADSIATGFRTIFTRIQRPRTINFLRDLGVELTDLKGQFVGPLEAVRRLSLALEKIPSTDIRFAQVVEELGGFRQVSKVIPLIQQFSTTQKALAVSQTGKSSLTEDAAKAQAALGVQIQKVREEFAKLIRDFTNDTTFRNLVDLTLKFASALIKVADAVRPLAPALAALGSIALGGAASKALGSVGSGKGFLGNIFKFASGGVVPGTGSGDTVPAMLEPGEFVLRKKAVKAIGSERLQKFNKGGQVKKYAGGGLVFGGLGGFGQINPKKISALGVDPNLLLGDEKSFKKGIAALRATNIGAGNKLADQFERKAYTAEGSKKTGEGIGAKAGTRLIDIGGNSPLFGGLFLRPLDSRDRTVKQTFPFKDLAKDVQGRLAGKFGQKDTKALSKYQVATNLDFGFIEPETSQRFDGAAQNKLFASVKGLIREFNPFGGSNISNDKIREITRTSNFEGALGSLFEAFTASVADVPPAGRGSQQNFDIPNVQSSRSKLAQLFGEFPESVRAADVKLSATNSNIKSIVKKAARYVTFEDVDNSIGVRNLRRIKEDISSNIISPRTGKSILKRAGGGPSGKDTQPALLTPGEFVFNKEAVDRIGLPALEKMNKVQKFNKGGFVGRYATGGSVASSALSPSGFLGASVILQTVSGFADLNTEVGKLINTVTSAGVQAAIFATTLKNTSSISNKRNIFEQTTAKKAELEEVVKPLRQPVKAANLAEAQANKATQEVNRLRNESKRIDKKLPTLNAADRKAALDRRNEIDKALPVKQETRRKALAARSRIDPDKLFEARQNLPEAERRLDIANRRNVRARRASRIADAGAGVAALAGAGASVLGSRLTEQSNASIQAGGTSTTKAGQGGALSGAAEGALIGAAIGSAVPIVGTALGALAGAIIGGTAGYVNAINDAAKQIEAVKFNKTIERFNNALKKGIEKGGAGSSGDIKAGLLEISNRINTTSGEDRVAAEGAAKNTLSDLQSFFDKIAKGSDSIDEFTKTVNKDTLILFSNFSKIPVEDVVNQYKKQIESQQATIQAQKRLTVAVDAFAKRMENTAVLGKSIDAASISLEGFSQSLLSEGPSGIQDSTAALAGGGAIGNRKQFEALTRSVGASFGGEGKESAESSIAANKLLTELPAVLASLKNVDLFGDDARQSFEDILKDRLSGAVGGGSDPATKSFIDLLGARAGQIIGDEGKSGKLKERLNTDFEGTVKEIGAPLEAASEVIQKEFKLIADRSKYLGEALQRAAQLTNQSIEDFNAGLDIQQQIDEFKESLTPDARFSARFQESTGDKQLKNITARLGGKTDVAGLTSDLIKNQAAERANNFAGTAEERAKTALATGKSDTQIQEDLKRSGVEFSENARAAAQGLNFIVTASQKLAAAKQKELDAIEAERKSRLSLAEEFAFGGPEARLNISENQNLIGRIQSGEVSAQQLDPASLQRLGQFLDKLDPNSIVAGGGTAGDFKREIIRSQAVGQMQITADPSQTLTGAGFDELTQGSAAEKNLQNEMIAALEKGREAQEGIGQASLEAADNLKNGIKDALGNILVPGIADSVAMFDKSIQDLIRAERDKFTKQAAANVQGEEAGVASSKNLLQKASGNIGFEINNKDDVIKAQKAAAQIQELDALKKKTDGRANFKTEAKGILESDVDEKTKQARLEELAGRSFTQVDSGALKKSSFFTGSKSVTSSVGVSSTKALSTEERLASIDTGLDEAGAKEASRDEINKKEQALQDEFGITSREARDAAANMTILNQQLAQLATIDFTAIENSKKKDAELQDRGFAVGGFVGGPPVRRDIIPARLMPGEYVLRKDAVSKIGVGTLDAMNSGSIAGYASGGLVDPEDFKRRLLEQKMQRDAAKVATDKLVSERQKAAAENQKAAGEQAKAQVDASQKAAKANFDAQQKANQTKVDSQRQGLAATNKQSTGLMDAFKASGAGGGKQQKTLAQMDLEQGGSFFGPAATAIRNIKNGQKPFSNAQLGLPSGGAKNKSGRLPIVSAPLTPTAQPTSSVSGAAPVVAATKTNQASEQRRGGGATPGPSGNFAQLEKAIASFDSVVNKLSETLGNLKAIQHEHTVNGRVEVIINSPDFGALGESMQKMIMDKVSSGINSWAKKNFGAEKVDNINFGNTGKEKK